MVPFSSYAFECQLENKSGICFQLISLSGSDTLRRCCKCLLTTVQDLLLLILLLNKDHPPIFELNFYYVYLTFS